MQVLILSVLMILSISSVFADGDCPERPANQQELAAFQAVYSAVKAAIPSAPKDWVLKDETDEHVGTTIPYCADGPKDSPKYYRFVFKYHYSDEASDRADQAAVGNALKGTPEQQARITELDGKIIQLNKRKKEARESGTAEEKNRIKEELKTVEKERSNLNKEITDAYVKRAMSGQLASDMDSNKPAGKEAQLIIKVNERRAWIPVRDAPETIPGAAHAYWCKEDRGGRLVILLGAWDAQQFKAKLERATVVTKAQNMVIEITADREMARTLAGQIKIDLLKKN